MDRKYNLPAKISIAALFALRFLFLVIVPFFVPGKITIWINDDLTYLFTGIFMLSIKNPDEFYLTKSFKLIFLAAPLLQLVIGLSIGQLKPFSFEKPIMAVVFSILFIIRGNLNFKSSGKVEVIRNVLFTLALTATAVLLSAVSLAVQAKIANTDIKENFSFPLILVNILAQINTAAISEEPLFRGIINSWLRKRFKNRVWVHVFSALSFTLAHIYYLDGRLISLFFVVPIGGIILSLIAERTKSLTYTTFTHGIINGTGNIIARLIYRLF